jgi:hypothetical protein
MITFPTNPPEPSNNPQSASSSPAAPEKPQSPGRPRTLTQERRREFLSLIASGLGMELAARHVGCSPRTIRREMKRDPDFAFDLEFSEKKAPLNPMKALYEIAQENWRAAAWLLERLFPERFGRRPQTSALGKRQARQLLNEVLQIIDADVIDPAQRDRVSGRIRATFEYLTHVYCERKRSRNGLHKAIEFFDQMEKHRDPFADLTSFTSSFHPACNQDQTPTAATEPSHPDAAPAPKQLSPDLKRPQTLSEAFQDLIDDLKAMKTTARKKNKMTKTTAPEVLSPTVRSNDVAEDKMDKTSPPQQTKSTEFHDRVQVNPDILT